MPGATEHAAAARRVIRQASTAALATLDAQSGAPYASLVTVATAFDASPILLISRLAQHRHNIESDDRVSLLFDATGGLADPLEGARVSVMGRAAVSQVDDDRRRFLARHPGAYYSEFGDFDFFRVLPTRAHLVAGFGRVYWIEWADLGLGLAPYAELAAAEAGIVDHMNEDHAEAVALYATRLAGGRDGAWAMTGIDPEGADLALDGERLRLDFGGPVRNAAEARQTLVALVAKARAAAGGESLERGG